VHGDRILPLTKPICEAASAQERPRERKSTERGRAHGALAQVGLIDRFGSHRMTAAAGLVGAAVTSPTGITSAGGVRPNTISREIVAARSS
jgi:hypothetical protein